ncbi:hypothetical protein HELRODRAFT_66482, partial [Helobdella robusta]|uniref:Solute carrier family 12 member 6 n=1 Tax=Helobdella robusta TaxID=6412 RepID=T1FYL9_HELRO
FQEDSHQRPFVSNIINRLANYEGGILPQMSEDEEEGNNKKKPIPKSTKLGTMMGVYFPCIQNIFGIIFFIRYAWVIGMAGWLQALIIVLLCCLCALITSISMSAIATNGVVAGGGSYFMISRALGPEFGGAVGVLFYLGTTVAASLYVVGAVEIFLQYMVPQATIFRPLSDPSNAFNNYRIYGSVLFLIMFVWVLIGVKFVSKVSVLALFCVILSIISIYIGYFFDVRCLIFIRICLVGDRLMSHEKVPLADCYKNISDPTSRLFVMYCGFNQSESDSPDCKYFKNNDVILKPGIPGLMSGIFKTDQTSSKYSDVGDRVGSTEVGDKNKGDVISDISSNFLILIGIIFPAVTGFMSGSNRSGDLSDAQKSIPAGTIGAVCTTSLMYITSVLLIAGCVEGQLLRDKFGESIGGGLILATIAWPTHWIVIIGAFLSTCGAGLQSLVGAPRLLQAIAADGVIPFLNFFSVTTKQGEPVRALILTGLIAEVGILIANIDNFISPVISEFFLMCYGFVNMACAVQTILRTPNWRPRFRFYHWSLSLLGVLLCMTLMLMTCWYIAIVAIVIAAFIYKYIEYKGAEKEWGDGIRGLAMSAARFALLRLEEGPPHVKNWRPQLLILIKLKDTLEPKYRKMLTFSTQLKEGKGLTLVGSVIEGSYSEKYADAQAAKQTLSKIMKSEKARGFAEVVVAESMTQGLCYLIQGSGVGGLTHNTVMLGWPHGWRHDEDEKSYKVFIDTLRNINTAQLAALIAKGIDQFPENTDKLVGTIDIWWIVHDGGLLMLLPFLLIQHKVWKLCSMRIFTVAQMDDNIDQIRMDLQTFLYHLRLKAEVFVVPLPDSAIRAYTYERALIMEQRSAMMKEMRLKRKRLRNMVRVIIGLHQQSPSPSTPDEDYQDTQTQAFDKVDGWSEENDKRDEFNEELLSIKPLVSVSVIKDKQNVRRMHTAVQLNEVIVEKSHDARLVILNLPGPPKSSAGEENYMEYLEVLTEGIDRVLMVRGGGREVITIYS